MCYVGGWQVRHVKVTDIPKGSEWELEPAGTKGEEYKAVGEMGTKPRKVENWKCRATGEV